MAQFGDFFGKIDFTVLCRLWKNHKELFEMIDFKDGKHALLKCNFNERQQPDEHGNTHYLQAACKKAERKEGVNYYVGNSFKPSQQNQQQQPAPAEPQQQAESKDDLPF